MIVCIKVYIYRLFTLFTLHIILNKYVLHVYASMFEFADIVYLYIYNQPTPTHIGLFTQYFKCLMRFKVLKVLFFFV